MVPSVRFTLNAMPATVTLSSKNQVVIPQEARRKLGVGSGARLLVLVKDDRIVFMPEPRQLVKRFWREVRDYAHRLIARRIDRRPSVQITGYAVSRQP
jgi:AbrB family looped-hinge helix DNA binding protein